MLDFDFFFMLAWFSTRCVFYLDSLIVYFALLSYHIGMCAKAQLQEAV